MRRGMAAPAPGGRRTTKLLWLQEQWKLQKGFLKLRTVKFQSSPCGVLEGIRAVGDPAGAAVLAAGGLRGAVSARAGGRGDLSPGISDKAHGPGRFQRGRETEFRGTQRVSLYALGQLGAEFTSGCQGQVVSMLRAHLASQH